MSDSTLIKACPLCFKTSRLIKSHIIPEFMYKPMYDASGKYVALTGKITDGEITGKKFLGTTGANEVMLCAECDNIALGARIEEPSKPIIEQVLSIDRTRSSHFIKVNYDLFKLFQISLLWRVSLSENPLFNQIKLPEKHSTRMRDMLINGNPGRSFDYGCMMLIFPDRSQLNSAMTHARKSKLDGHTIVHVSTQGIHFIYAVSSHMRHFKHRDRFLQDDGTLRIDVAPKKFVEAELAELTSIVQGTSSENLS